MFFFVCIIGFSIIDLMVVWLRLLVGLVFVIVRPRLLVGLVVLIIPLG